LVAHGDHKGRQPLTLITYADPFTFTVHQTKQVVGATLASWCMAIRFLLVGIASVFAVMVAISIPNRNGDLPGPHKAKSDFLHQPKGCPFQTHHGQPMRDAATEAPLFLPRKCACIGEVL
jgi:hypothetical protein